MDANVLTSFKHMIHNINNSSRKNSVVLCNLNNTDSAFHVNGKPVRISKFWQFLNGAIYKIFPVKTATYLTCNALKLQNLHDAYCATEEIKKYIKSMETTSTIKLETRITTVTKLLEIKSKLPIEQKEGSPYTANNEASTTATDDNPTLAITDDTGIATVTDENGILGATDEDPAISTTGLETAVSESKKIEESLAQQNKLKIEEQERKQKQLKKDISKTSEQKTMAKVKLKEYKTKLINLEQQISEKFKLSYNKNNLALFKKEYQTEKQELDTLSQSLGGIYIEEQKNKTELAYRKYTNQDVHFKKLVDKYNDDLELQTTKNQIKELTKQIEESTKQIKQLKDKLKTLK